MAENDKFIGFAVLVAFIIIALAYTYLVNKPATAATGSNAITNHNSSGIIGSENNSGTKIVIYNNPNGSAKNGQSSATSGLTTNFTHGTYSVPIVLENFQQNATQIGFQAMIVVRSSDYSGYIDRNWSNVEFTTLPEGGGTLIPAWIESNASPSSNATVVWLKLPVAIKFHNTTTVYMDFVNFPVLSRVGPTGEAPELSPTYAQYDDGAEVFNFYDNFLGTTLNTKLWSDASAFASNPVIVKNGLTIGRATSKQNNGYNAVISIQAFSQGVIDFYGTMIDNSTQPHYQDIGLVPASANNACNLIDVGSFYGPGDNGLQLIDSYCNAKYSAGLSFGGPRIYSIFVPSLNPTSATATVNYSDPIKLTFTSIILPQTIGFENQGDTGNLGPIYWIRQRDYPVGEVMPTVSFGKLQ